MSVHQIVSKWNIAPLKDFNINGLSANNASKKEFARYCEMYGFQKHANTNSYIVDGEHIAFSVCRTYEAECRQFATYYTKLVCLFPNGEYGVFHKDELNIGNVSRIGPDGTKYHNVKGLKQNAK